MYDILGSVGVCVCVCVGGGGGGGGGGVSLWYYCDGFAVIII